MDAAADTAEGDEFFVGRDDGGVVAFSGVDIGDGLDGFGIVPDEGDDVVVVVGGDGILDVGYFGAEVNFFSVIEVVGGGFSGLGELAFGVAHFEGRVRFPGDEGGDILVIDQGRAFEFSVPEEELWGMGCGTRFCEQDFCGIGGDRWVMEIESR